MKHRNKLFAALTAVALTAVSFTMLSVSAEDTTGAIVTELGRTEAKTGLEYSTTEAYEGTRSIHINSSAWTSYSSTDMLGMTNTGKGYNVSFYIKGTVGSGFIIGQDYLKIKDNVTTGFSELHTSSRPTITDAGDGWYKIESTSAWESPATNKLLFYVIGQAVNVYIDNLSITEADTGTEIITNGGFEEVMTPTPSGSDTTGAVITAIGNTEAISGLEYSTIDAYEGTRAIHITSGGEMTTPAKLGLTSGATYNFSFMIKGVLTTSNGMYLRMGWGYASNAAKIKSDSSGVFTVQSGAGDGILQITADTDGWYKVETTIPWTCSEMNIGFFNVQSGGGTVNFYIDNLSIVDSETGTEMISNGSFEPPAVEIGKFEMSTTPEGKQKVSVSVTNNSAGSDINAILILVTVKDKIMQQKKTDLPDTGSKMISEGNSETLEAEITVNQGETLKAYLWDSLGGKTPLRNAEVLEVIQSN